MRNQAYLNTVAGLAYVGFLALLFIGLATLPGRMSQHLEAFHEARAAAVAVADDEPPPAPPVVEPAS